MSGAKDSGAPKFAWVWVNLYELSLVCWDSIWKVIIPFVLQSWLTCDTAINAMLGNSLIKFLKC